MPHRLKKSEKFRPGFLDRFKRSIAQDDKVERYMNSEDILS